MCQLREVERAKIPGRSRINSRDIISPDPLFIIIYPFLLSIRNELSTECLVTAVGPSASALTEDSPPAASSQHSSQHSSQAATKFSFSVVSPQMAALAPEGHCSLRVKVELYLPLPRS